MHMAIHKMWEVKDLSPKLVSESQGEKQVTTQ